LFSFLIHNFRMDNMFFVTHMLQFYSNERHYHHYRTLAVTDSASFPEWIFILVVGLHIWFNMKIEKMYGFMMTCKRATFSATGTYILHSYLDRLIDQIVKLTPILHISMNRYLHINTYLHRSSYIQ
jgi:hypothetical protein